MPSESTRTRAGAAAGPPAAPAPPRRLARFAPLLLILAILAVAGGVSAYWLTYRPTAKRRPPKPQAVLVEVRRVSPTSEPVVVRAMGEVVPAREIKLAARVSGEIVKVSPQFVPGGHIKAVTGDDRDGGRGVTSKAAEGPVGLEAYEALQGDQRILQIDPRDYKLVVRQRTGDLAKAQCELKVEIGRVSVAKREAELLGRVIKQEDEDLGLRKPQLAMARSAVSAAEAALQKAQLDQKRTTVTTPFNAVVQSRSVNLGSQVAVGSPLASLAGTDEYWVQVSVPVDQLKWIDIPVLAGEKGSPVRVYYEAAWGAGPDAFRAGTVSRLMPDLEPQGRMARVLVAVADPLHLSAPLHESRVLILGAYVRVEITGRRLEKVVRVSRTALRDGDSVWVMKPDHTLDIRQVRIKWSGNEYVCVGEGLRDGDLLITSDLGAPVQGVALRPVLAKARGSATRPSNLPSRPHRKEQPR